jgi:hypothetical protein
MFWAVGVDLGWKDLFGVEVLEETESFLPSQVHLCFHWECKLEAVVLH